MHKADYEHIIYSMAKSLLRLNYKYIYIYIYIFDIINCNSTAFKYAFIHDYIDLYMKCSTGSCIYVRLGTVSIRKCMLFRTAKKVAYSLILMAVTPIG